MLKHPVQKEKKKKSFGYAVKQFLDNSVIGLRLLFTKDRSGNIKYNSNLYINYKTKYSWLIFVSVFPVI